MIERINALYFSPTGTTKKVVTGIAEQIFKKSKKDTILHSFDFTLPAARKDSLYFNEEDLLIIGVPVIAGRVPNVLLKYLNSMAGNGALAVAVVVYGNRNYDDALIELKNILEDDGFKVFAAGAFIGEHSFSDILAKNRPDEKDMAVTSEFADQIIKKMALGHKIQTALVKGETPYRDYYRPKDAEGNPVDIRKVTPKTNSNCTNCMLCAMVCPMGSIDFEDVTKLNGICIKCCACVKKCPRNAKYFDDYNYLRHKHELEIGFAFRKEPELF